MKPDIDRAAIRALETIIDHNITAAPVMPLPILKSIPNVFVVSYTEMAEQTGLGRESMLESFGETNQDACTFVQQNGGELHYFVAYNQRLPFYLLQRGLARELGNILLGHDGHLPEDVRLEEAIYFSRHLLCPRPLIHMIQESGIELTLETVGNLTGCYERCVAGMRKTPGAHVPAELNRKVRDQFSNYVRNFLNFHRVAGQFEDASALADFGSFMDGYEE